MTKKAKCARNEHYNHVETITVTVDIEIGYSCPAAREDALRVAKEMCTGGEIGGCGRAGSYNAIRIGNPVVEP